VINHNRRRLRSSSNGSRRRDWFDVSISSARQLSAIFAVNQSFKAGLRRGQQQAPA